MKFLTKIVRNKILPITCNDAGSIGPIFAMCLIPTVVLLGGSLDISRALTAKYQLQNAVDLAAIAAVSVPDTASSEQIARANSQLAVFEAEHTAGVSVASTNVESDGDHVTVTASAKIKTTLLSLINIREIDVDVRAESLGQQTVTETVTASPCAMVMDPHGFRTFQLDSPSKMNAGTCEVDVLSDNSNAAWIHSPSSTSFKRICIKGGTSGSMAGVAVNCNAPIGDPVAATLPSVTVPSACTYTNATLTGSYTPTQVSGVTVLCGNNTFGGNTLTLSPGLYIIKDGKLSITAKTSQRQWRDLLSRQLQLRVLHELPLGRGLRRRLQSSDLGYLQGLADLRGQRSRLPEAGQDHQHRQAEHGRHLLHAEPRPDLGLDLRLVRLQVLDLHENLEAHLELEVPVDALPELHYRDDFDDEPELDPADELKSSREHIDGWAGQAGPPIGF